MADIELLKRLAERLINPYENYATPLEFERELDEFEGLARPATVLALIAENAATESRLHEVAVACATAEQERDQLKAENSRLRQIISDSATACGAAMSPECTVEFMGHLPAEIAGVLGQLRAELERARAEGEALQKDRAELLAALKGMSDMYGYCWDLVGGGLMCMEHNVQRFEDAHEVAHKLIQTMGKGGRADG